MTSRKPKRLSEVSLNGYGRPFDASDSRCISVEQELVARCHANGAQMLADNLDYLTESHLLTGDMVFDFVDEPTFNASVANERRHDIILINSAIPICLFILFSKFLSCRNVFPWVGDPSAERDEVTPLEGLPDSFVNPHSLLLLEIIRQQPGDFLENIEKLPPELHKDLTRVSLRQNLKYSVDFRNFGPVDPKRGQFAGILLRWSMQFILFHELGHILHGHLDYTVNHLRMTDYREIDSSTKSKLRQSQEYQADTFATIATFLPVLSNREILYNEFFGKDPRKIEYAWGFAAATIFTVLALTEGADLDEEHRTHPNPTDRLVSALFSAGVKAGAAKLNVDLDCSPMEAWQDLDALLERVLKGNYKRAWKEEKHILNIPIAPVLGQYEHLQEWAQYDRLQKLHETQKTLSLRIRL